MTSVGQEEDGRDLYAVEKNGTGLAIMENTTEVLPKVELPYDYALSSIHLKEFSWDRPQRNEPAPDRDVGGASFQPSPTAN